jgi:hypothetical protein
MSGVTVVLEVVVLVQLVVTIPEAVTLEALKAVTVVLDAQRL